MTDVRSLATKKDFGGAYALRLQIDTEEKAQVLEEQILEDFLYLMSLSGTDKPTLPISDDPVVKEKQIRIRCLPEYSEAIERLFKNPTIAAMDRRIQQHFEEGDYKKMKDLIDGESKLVGMMSKSKSPLVALQINTGSQRTGTDLSDLKE